MRDSSAVTLTYCGVISQAAVAATGLTISHSQPVAGSVSLEHIGSVGRTWSFRLVNHSGHSIFFRGYGGTLSNVVLPWASAQCGSIEPGVGASEGPPLVDGFGEQQVFEVRPERQRFIDVDTTLGYEYQGGQCKVVLMLEGGTEVESDTWIEPRK